MRTSDMIGRRFLAVVIAMLASVAIVLTLLAHYVDHVLVNQDQFAGRATQVLQARSVRSQITSSVTEQVTGNVGQVPGAQPVIANAVRTAVSSRSVSEEVRAAAISLHGQLVSGTAGRLALSLPDIGTLIASRVESQSPALVDSVRSIGTVTVVDVPIPPAAATAFHDVARFGKRAQDLLIISIALVLLALLISPDRRRTLIGLGLRAVVSGLLVVGLYLAGRGIVLHEFAGADVRAVARTVWSTYLVGLETAGIVLAAVGAAVAVTAALVLSGNTPRLTANEFRESVAPLRR